MSTPNQLHVQDLYVALSTAIQAAWGTISISPERPRQTIALPYAVVDLPSDVPQAFQTMRKVEQSYDVQITGRFSWPVDATDLIRFEQEARANELIAQLQTGATFGTIFYSPLVTSVSFEQETDLQNAAYEVALMFSCKTEVDHH